MPNKKKIIKKRKVRQKTKVGKKKKLGEVFVRAHRKRAQKVTV